MALVERAPLAFPRFESAEEVALLRFAPGIEMAPPGLEMGETLLAECELLLPPGLERSMALTGLTAPPGLSLEVDMDASYPQSEEQVAEGDHPDNLISFAAKPVEVLLTGLPNEILSNVMLEVMFEQAGLEKFVLSFCACNGSPFGEVLVFLSTEDAAEQCVEHFSGCEWAEEGKVVCAKVQNRHAEIKPQELSVDAVEFVPAARKELSADAVEFVPASMLKLKTTVLSAEAKPFIPTPVLSADAKPFFPACFQDMDDVASTSTFASDLSDSDNDDSHSCSSLDL